MRDRMQELDMLVSVEDAWGGDIVAAAVSHLAASTRFAGSSTTVSLTECISDAVRKVSVGAGLG